MSVDRIFTISIAGRRDGKLEAASSVNCFLKSGWSLYSLQGEMIYTGIGDKDDFEFLAERISESADIINGEAWDAIVERLGYTN